MPLVKFSTLGGGVFIEQDNRDSYEADTRCFRFNSDGSAEWTSYGNLLQNSGPDNCRWYGHVLKKDDFTFA